MLLSSSVYTRMKERYDGTTFLIASYAPVFNRKISKLSYIYSGNTFWFEVLSSSGKQASKYKKEQVQEYNSM